VPVSVHWKVLKNAIEKERLMVLMTKSLWVLMMAYEREVVLVSVSVYWKVL